MKETNTLVQKAVKGDTGAFAQLYKEIYKELYYIALSALGSPDDAADCVEDAVLDAYTGIRKLKNEEAFRAYIIKILLAKIKRKQKEYYRQRQTEELSDAVPECRNQFADVEIAQALASLSDAERECVTLSLIAGYKGEEIAKLTGIAHATVRSHLSRARAKLKKFLSDSEQ